MATIESVAHRTDESTDFLGSANRLRTVPNAPNPFVRDSNGRTAIPPVRIEPEAIDANRTAAHGSR
jgi:hypothetical protein